jgi:primase-polymerase (primpol)-like protein
VKKGDGIGFVFLENTEQVFTLLDDLRIVLCDKLKSPVELSLHYGLD